MRLADVFSFLNLSFGLAGLSYVFSDVGKAAIFVYLAALMDGADGYIATRKGNSDFGRELDSLADLVSFGVLPAMMLWSMSETLFPIALAYLIAGAFRLARFNVTGSNDFVGMPITASALLLSSVIHLSYFQFAPFLAILLSLLMVSRWRYVKIKDMSLLSLFAAVLIVSIFVRDASYALIFFTAAYAAYPLVEVVRNVKKSL
jgi:CDP-diacylglycerol--serine O-phosphatidyltransferase